MTDNTPEARVEVSAFRLWSNLITTLHFYITIRWRPPILSAFKSMSINQIYRELAQQKKEKEDQENANKPRNRDYVLEQSKAIEEVRKKEEEAGEREIKQKNEGGWDFRWDEESRPGFVLLDVPVARHLDSSLIDVDVHPTYVSIIIKSKVKMANRMIRELFFLNSTHLVFKCISILFLC